MRSIKLLVENGWRVALVASFVLAAGLAMDVHAEVAVWVDPGNQELKAAAILQSIVDDPEPVGVAWIRSHGSEPGLVVLNENGTANGDGAPSMAVDFATQTAVVVWSKNNPGGYDIVISRLEAGAWTTPTTIAAESADELDPVVVLDPSDGTVHVVYWIDDGSPRVLHRSAPADLSSFSAVRQVSLAEEVALRPSAVFHDGQLRVAYEVHDYGAGATPRQIAVATLDPLDILDGQGAFGHEGLTVTQHGGANWPRIHSKRGRLWIDWIDATGEMGWIRREGTGWSPVGVESFTDVEERDYHVRGWIGSLATTP